MDTNFIEILMSGKNQVTSALLPSFIFVVVLALIFSPVTNFTSGVEALREQGLSLLILSVILGVFLQYTNAFLYKFLEGYGFLSRIAFLKKKKIKQATILLVQREELARQIRRLEKRISSEKARTQLPALKDKYYSVSVNYDQILKNHFSGSMRSDEFL